eukprot:Skav208788  [mRNA]  locus=scaffold931:264665:267248:- [translate_table: standard]
MVVCAKCRQVPPNEGDTWCLGCSAWELIERELKSRWPGAQGLRQVAENLLVSAAREVRALRGISLGTSRPLEPAGAPPRAVSAAAKAEETAGATAKSKAVKEEPESSASYYEDEESEEERQAEQKESSGRQGCSGAGSTGAPKETLARSSGHRGEERGYTPRHRGDGGKESEGKRRSRSKSLERKKRPRTRSEEAERERRRKESGKTSGKKRKGKRAGRKHKRVGRVRGMTESVDRVWPEGEWVTCQSDEWRLFRAVIGDVLEIECSEVEEERGPGVFASFVIEETMAADDGGWLIRGRYLGASDSEIAKELAKKVSRMRRPLHLCWHQPCTQHGEVLDYVHVLEARWWSLQHFEAHYLKSWARALIAERRDKVDDGKERPSKGKEKPPGPGKKKRAPKDGGPKEDKPSKKKKKGEDGPATTAGLRARLARVRERLLGHGYPAQPEVIDVDNGDALDGEYDEELFGDKEPKDGLDAGDQLGAGAEGTGLLAIEDGQVGEVKKEKEVKKKMRKLKKRVKRSPQALLLAQAEQKRKQGEEERRRKRRRRSKKGAEGKVRALVKALGVGSNKKEGKKKKRRLGGGDEPSDSDDSGYSGSEEDEEDGSSEESELMAPLQKKSKKSPGAVLKMLTEHARQVMDQSSGLSAASHQGITRGVKLSSYFNLMVRPYFPATSRDMKELHHLAVSIDQLREGDLGLLGDSLASRFLAIHTAVNDGHWRAAQYLELHPLEPTQGAPTALLLEAQKHGRLVDKSRGWDQSRNRNYGGDNTYRYGGKGGDSKGKSKGKNKGDWKGRGKGAGKWDRQGKDDTWWGEKRDGKAGKEEMGKKDGKEASK